MKKEPFDSLTEQDKYNIRKYIYLYANCNCGPLDIVLKEWNKSKRRLYHAFGNKLRIEKDIKLDKDVTFLKKLLSEIYSTYSTYYLNNLTYLKNVLTNIQQTKKMNFYQDFALFILNHPKLSLQEQKQLLKMFQYENIVRGYFAYNFELKQISFSVRPGAKTIRTIQKCIKALGYTNIELFNQWRNQINIINSNQLANAKMVISIHPIDFMTMSDNNCNWSSCMSWTKDGCYSGGTIEMMNSNVTAVAYIETKTKFQICLDEENILSLPNKSWRSLIYCHKNLIMAGKSYPYHKDELSKEAILFMKEAVEKSFHWKYQYGPQLYLDIAKFHGNSFLKDSCNPRYKKGKKIIVHTNGMYNDIVEDSEESYWCYRNKTNGIKINLSGKYTCMCCGQEIEKTYYLSEPSDVNNKKICWSCESNRKCPICEAITYETDNEYHLCSDACKREAIIFPGQKVVINRVDFLSDIEVMFIIFTRDQQTYDKILNIVDCFDGYNKMISNRTILVRFIKEKLQDNYLYEPIDYELRVVPSILRQKGLLFIPHWSGYFRKIYTPDAIRGYNLHIFNITKAQVFLQELDDLNNFYRYNDEGRLTK